MDDLWDPWLQVTNIQLSKGVFSAPCCYANLSVQILPMGACWQGSSSCYAQYNEKHKLHALWPFQTEELQLSALAWGCLLLQESWPSGRTTQRKHRENLISQAKKPADVQKLLLIVVEVHGVLRRTPANTVEPINTNTDRKCFCQLKGMRKTRRGTRVLVLRTNKKGANKSPQTNIKKPINKQSPTPTPKNPHRQKREAWGWCLYGFLLILNTYKPQPPGANQPERKLKAEQ